MATPGSATAFGTGMNILSNWPAGIQYSPEADKYLYSVQHSWNISALDHLHVVAIDEPQIGSVPNVLTLTLPVSYNLPLQSRFYFFYVSEANSNDQLVFSPVFGSGDTINGNAVNYTFVLSGNPQLYIAICVNHNYIIHAFGQNHFSAALPTEVFFFDQSVGPLFGPSPSSPFPGSSDMFLGNGASSAPLDIVSGMEGFLTPNSAIPTQAFQGFLCNQSGLYMINPQMHGSLQYAAGLRGTNLGALQCNLLEFDPTGGYHETTSGSSFVPWSPASNPLLEDMYWNWNTSFFYPLVAGRYYVLSATWDNSSSGTIGLGPNVWSGIAAFVYWAPDIPIGPGPSLFSPTSVPSPSPALMTASRALSANVAPESFTPVHKPFPGAAKLQKDLKDASTSRSNPQGSYIQQAGGQPSLAPSISLADIERIVGQAVAAERARSQSSSSSISSSSSSSAPASKRKRVSEKDPA